jgi:hypothetical protein
MRIQITTNKRVVFWMLDTLLALWTSKPKKYPYNRRDAVIPQTLIPHQIRKNPFVLACFYFYVCIYMRGGIESFQAFFAMIRMWFDHPMLFIPQMAARLEPEAIQAILKVYVGWDSKQASIHWVENSRRLVKHYPCKNSMTSPSCTTYSLPSVRMRPSSRALARLPASISFCQLMASARITSARINLSLKSLCMAAPASGAVLPCLMVHARVSSSPVVKKLIRPK